LRHIFTTTLSLTLALTLFACAGKQKNILETRESQVKLRSIQSRVYDTADRNRLLRRRGSRDGFGHKARRVLHAYDRIYSATGRKANHRSQQRPI
jgi:hypothetical protein